MPASPPSESPPTEAVSGTDSGKPSPDETRFAFGENWAAFLETLDDQRIEQAVASLQSMLAVDDLSRCRFLDIGSGSGLFSLAAHRLGADVVSIDYDEQSVHCTQTLKDRYTDSSERSWLIHRGSVLDPVFMKSLGQFDVVYSWGVLHHTGEMDRAIEMASQRVAPQGLLYIAIYNDQGSASRRWLWIKRMYHRLPKSLRWMWVVAVAGVYELRFAMARLARFRNPLPLADWRAKRKDRGMSAWHDWVDWVGGMPFEVATPEHVIVPLARKGFHVVNLKTVGNGWGCNEYVLTHDTTKRREP
ncbi:class I SAM-dependent methyltransferase [Stieleria varia]|uniref:Magnesium-protoporphyrin O-methyltransferase n=1 Tax=Stieleria varia TaxID=2528005 RepID=A0A5C6B4M8_9BACT|nr:class I SAM-dependent methyltransferase [Stieleria varia]TWU06431.1 Magnesium-protoporphyrin O-methyltransferase [Stieleria varia]